MKASVHSSPWGKRVSPEAPLRRQLPEVFLPARAASPPCVVCPSFASLAVVDKPCNAGMTATGYRLAGGCVGAAYGVVEKPRCGRVCRHSGESRNPFLRLSPFVRVPAHRRGMKSRCSFTRTRKWIPAFAGMTIKSEQQNNLPASGGALWEIISPWKTFSTTPFGALSGQLPATLGCLKKKISRTSSHATGVRCRDKSVFG